MRYLLPPCSLHYCSNSYGLRFDTMFYLLPPCPLPYSYVRTEQLCVFSLNYLLATCSFATILLTQCLFLPDSYVPNSSLSGLWSYLFTMLLLDTMFFLPHSYVPNSSVSGLWSYLFTMSTCSLATVLLTPCSSSPTVTCRTAPCLACGAACSHHVLPTTVMHQRIYLIN